MLIGQLTDSTENVTHVLKDFKANFPASCDNFSSAQLEAFNTKMDSFTKAPRNPNAYAFLAYLASKDLEAHILSLKQKATKKKPFSFERLSLVLLPIFKFFETKKVGGEGEIQKIDSAL